MTTTYAIRVTRRSDARVLMVETADSDGDLGSFFTYPPERGVSRWVKATDREGLDAAVKRTNADPSWDYTVELVEPTYTPVEPLPEPLPTEPGFYIRSDIPAKPGYLIYALSRRGNWSIRSSEAEEPITEAELRAKYLHGHKLVRLVKADS